MDTSYKSNSEPKIGDKVRFTSAEGTKATHEVTDVALGRMCNKVCIKPIGQNTFSREYYYYVLTPVERA